MVLSCAVTTVIYAIFFNFFNNSNCCRMPFMGFFVISTSGIPKAIIFFITAQISLIIPLTI